VLEHAIGSTPVEFETKSTLEPLVEAKPKVIEYVAWFNQEAIPVKKCGTCNI